MTEDETHPMSKFLHETSEGRVAYSPSTEKDTGLHWIFNRENHGYNFNFVVHDRDGVIGKEMYAKDIQWVGHFIHNRKFEYVDEPPEQVQEMVSESVEVREEPVDIAEMETVCSGCGLLYEVCVMPRMDLVIEGSPVQRVFEETCPECGEEIVEKTTYAPSSGRQYPEDVSELDAGRLWEFSRRTP